MYKDIVDGLSKHLEPNAWDILPAIGCDVLRRAWKCRLFSFGAHVIKWDRQHWPLRSLRAETKEKQTAELTDLPEV